MKRKCKTKANMKLKQQRLQLLTKMCFFDKSNNSMIVVAFKQRLNGRDHEKLFTGIAKMGALRSALR